MAQEQNIDKLTIEIEAKAKNTSDGLEKLAEKIRKLREELYGAESPLGDFYKKMEELQESIKSVSIITPKVVLDESFNRAIESFREFNEELRKTLDLTRETLYGREFFQSAKEARTPIDDMTRSATEFIELYEIARDMVESTGKKHALKEFDTQQHSYQDLENIIAQARAHEQNTESIKNESQAFTGLKSQLEQLKDIISPLSEITPTMQAFSDTYDRMLKMSETPLNLTAYSPTEIQMIRDEADAHYKNADAIHQEAIAQGELNNLRKSASGYIDTLNMIQQSQILLNNSVEETRKEIDDIVSNLSSGYKNITNILSETRKTRREMSGITTETGRARKATNGWFGSLLTMAKRLLILRPIHSFMNGITNGAKEGIQNIVHFSNEANAAMSTLATDSLYLKNTFAAVATPILQVVAPAIDWLTDRIVNFSNTVGEFFAAFTGADTYTRAVKQTVNYAESLDNASSSAIKAAKAQRQLISGFDELNIFSSNKDSSGSGNKTNEKDYAGMFEVVKIDSKIRDMAKNAKKWVDAFMPLFEGFGSVVSSVADAVSGFADKYFFPWLESLGEWAADNPTAMRTIGEGIAWVVGAIAISKLIRAAGELGSISKSLVGITMAIGGFALIFDAAKAITKGDYSAKNYIQLALGSALGLGASLLTFGTGPLGWTIGIVAALGVTIGSFVIASNQNYKELYQNSDLYKQIQGFKEEVKRDAEITAQMKLNYEITISKFDNLEDQFATYKAQIERVFELDEQKVKTQSDIDEMIAIVQQLNDMGLTDLKLEFNDPNNGLNPALSMTKDEALKATEAIKKLAEADIAREVLVDLYKQQVQLQIEKQKQQDKYNDLLKQEEALTKENNELADRGVELQKELDELGKDWFGLFKIYSKEEKERRDQLRSELDILNEKYAINKQALEDLQEPLKDQLQSLKDQNDLWVDIEEALRMQNYSSKV